MTHTSIRMTKYSIGIIGNGFVGEALTFAFSTHNKVLVYDINPLKSKVMCDEVHKCDIVFICVPTPMFQNGSQDLKYVLDVFKNSKEKPIYVIKSTILPGTTKKIQKLYPNLKVVFSPEFLSENTAKSDIVNMNRLILGGEKVLTSTIKEFFENRFPNLYVLETDSLTAETIKYMNNAFLATKVSIMNEFKLFSDEIGANWKDAVNGFASDPRIGNSHLQVPGPDGKLGYGGTCFPKDINTFILFAKNKGIDLNAIVGGWKTNLFVRPEKDWEKNKGRTISN